MATLRINNARLTGTGMAKFDKLNNLAERGLLAMLENVSQEIKDRIAVYAPTPQQERDILAGNTFEGQDYDFFKNAEMGFSYLSDAIMKEDIPVVSDGNILTAKFGNSGRLNQIIGFFWYHGQGDFRSTLDPEASSAWQNLLEMFEFGGGPLLILPRDPDSALTIARTPKGGSIVVDSIEKTVPPFAMYQTASKDVYPIVRRKAAQKLKEVISWL